jgi:hypothetical protein
MDVDMDLKGRIILFYFQAHNIYFPPTRSTWATCNGFVVSIAQGSKIQA